MARAQLEELALHVRAAVRNGLAHEEIKEVLLQGAICCEVPAANAAFAVALRVLETTMIASASGLGSPTMPQPLFEEERVCAHR
jgi:alkylhydroperoxidase/carboxymuconolactone decarboxylase family protein YurZ